MSAAGRSFVLGLALLAALAGASRVVRAQDSLPPTPTPTPADTAKPAPDTTAHVPLLKSGLPETDTTLLARRPIAPWGALWRSFLLPGWGQAKLDRKLSAGIFIAVEGATLGMAIKTTRELRYLDRTQSSKEQAKREEREDWLVLMGFNHLMAGIEAYVSAHLWDFPEDLRFRAMPGGGVGASVSIPVRLR